MSKRQTLKQLGLVGPHPVDRRLGFVDATKHHIHDHPAGKSPNGLDFDKMRIGRIEDGRLYMGGNCWQRVNRIENNA